MPERRPAVLAALLALALNLAGIGWGLPSRFHPDEKADVVAAMVREGRLLPDSYVNPSLPLLLTAPFVAAQRATLGEDHPWGDPLLLARALSALAGAGAVLVLGFAAARLDPLAGRLAPFFLALAPGVVNLSHFATPEAWLLLGAATVLLLSLRHAEGLSPAWALGLALGLAASTKYTAAALAAPALAAAWLRPRAGAGRADRAAWLAAGAAALVAGALLAGPPGSALAATLRLPDARLLHPESARGFVRGLAAAALAAGGAALLVAAAGAWRKTAGLAGRLARREVVIVLLAAAAGFVAGTPGAVLEPRAFLSDLAFNAQTRHEYKGLVGEATSWWAYLALAGDALTLPVLAAALAGLALAAWGAWLGHRVALVALLAAAAPYALVASSGHQAMRFLAPALPAAAALAALAVARIRSAPHRRAVAAALLLRSALAAALVVRLFFVDSRILAERWMERNVPPGSTVDLVTNHEGYAPRVPEGRTARVARTLSREMAPAERFEAAARAYPAEGAEWLVLTGSFYQRFLDHPEQRPERARFFRDLLEGRGGYGVAARFRQEGWLRPEAEFLDPEIVILRRAPEPSR
jgi:hypothetical protein